MLNYLRSILNKYFATPIVTFMRTWILNVIVGHIPWAGLRYLYYKMICQITIGEQTEIWTGVRFVGGAMDKISIGKFSVIPHGALLVAGDAIRIGDNVVFGHDVQLYTSDHDPDDPTFARRDAPIEIHDNVWVGSRAIILKGVTIGEGAVVAAGSVVTRDVESFSIVGGNPARKIRDRGTRTFV
tara:strand:+ start:621 stop:1172 length:552 start_codon:yes stop_codon:yes gene_type:complete